MGATMAIVKDNVVYIGADANVYLFNLNHHVDLESNFHVHKLDSGIIIATSGKEFVTQQLWLHDEWFELDEGEVFDKKFLVTKVIPKFYDAIKDFDIWEEDKENGFNLVDEQFIIAKGSDLFLIDRDLSVTKCGEYAIISENNEYYLMYGYAKLCEDTPEVILKKTFDFTTRRAAKIKNHGYVINTKDLEFKKMEDIDVCNKK